MVRGTQLSALFLIGLVSGQAGAVDGTTFGLGAGASGGGASIYFPIRTGSLIIEPRISYFHNERKSDGSDVQVIDYPPAYPEPQQTWTGTSQWVATSETKELGLGLFSRNQITEEIEIYFGGRFGIRTFKSRANNRSDQTVAPSGYVHISIGDSIDKQDGYFLAPSFGLQYFPRPNFSFGIEVAFEYSNLSGSVDFSSSRTTDDPRYSTESRSGTRNSDTENYGTVTAAILRGYF